MKKVLFSLVFLSLLSLAHAQTKWTDIFEYWKQWPQVKEGAFKYLFITSDSDLSCWHSFEKMRDFYGTLNSVSEITWWNFAETMKGYCDSQILTLNFY